MGRLSPSSEGKALYTIEQRQRRDSSPWTVVQGVLAAFQFLVFLASLVLVIRTLITGEGAFIANVSVLFKTLVLYTIMITGSLWKRMSSGSTSSPRPSSGRCRELRGDRPPHRLCGGTPHRFLGQHELMLLVLAAYGLYAVNAFQFLWKLRQARLGAKPVMPRGQQGASA